MAALDILDTESAAAALMHPVRRQILTALATPGSATTVGKELGIPRQKVNYHLRALEEAGVVEHVEDRRRGNCTERVVRATARHYVISPSVLGELEASPQATADRLSSDHLAAVSARTISELGELRRRADAAGKRLATMSIETGVRFAAPADHQAFAEELTACVARLVSKYHDESAETGRWFRAAVGVHPALNARAQEPTNE